MSSYNKVNGVWASENNYILREILKDEWSFDGVVISDWNGTYTDGPAAGGLDLEMPGPARWMGDNVLEMVRAGQLSEDMINDKVRRLLRLIERVGAFDNPELQPEGSIDKPEHRAIVRQAASEAIVLLKNEAGLLPVDPTKFEKIAVIGQNALKPPIMGGGSSSVTPHVNQSPLAAILERVGDDVDIQYALGASLHKEIPLLDVEMIQADGKPGFKVQIFDNLDLAGEPVVTHYVDRTSLSWFDAFVAPANPQRFSAKLTANFTPSVSGMHTFSLGGNGISKLFIDGDLVIDGWNEIPPEDPWSAPEEEPSVQLSAGRTYVLQIEFLFESQFPWRGLRINHLPPISADLLDEALTAASQADLVLLFVGNTKEWEAEGFDRPNMDLPQGQDELVENVLKVNPNTVVILNTGSPVGMPWVDNVPALLQAWFGGQEMGNAIADVLFGFVNPSGKLPTTFPVRLQDNPTYLNYPGENGRVHYGEGLFVGYRYYDYKDIVPLFPFGHGLSYTQFTYGNIDLSTERIQVGDTLTVRLEVSNVGQFVGKEIVQLYIRDVASSLVRPRKELKGFAKLDLRPGETQTVSFEITEDDLAYYDDLQKKWIAEPGIFELYIGASSQDLRVTTQFELIPAPSDDPTKAARLHIGLPLEAVLADEAGKAILEKHLGDLLQYHIIRRFYKLSLAEIAPRSQGYVTTELLQIINADLAKVP
jgi:beta-glucosidase